VPAEVVAREKDIYVQQALDSGKPEAIVEKMVTGKIEKYLAEIVLLEQKFIKNPDLSIQDILNDLVGRIGENISIKKFARFQIGVE
jgi:elongation factor Ts